ncbi:MAG: hypothetical protein ABR582_15820 [Gemmatimonadaceae bacterium]
MPSRVEMRLLAERGLRGVVVAVLVFLLWRSLFYKESSALRENVGGRPSSEALSTWSNRSTAPGKIHVQLDSVPSPLERAWLRALAGAGSAVTWSGNLPPVMIEAQPVASPTGGVKARVAAPTGSTVVIGDDVGVLDTLRAVNSGAALTLNSSVGGLTGRMAGATASTIPRDSVVLHKALVIGDANWESKFVVAALEEAGWKVDALIRVAPSVDVTQGSTAAIDTSRYSAVVALDGSASPYASRLVDYVQSGGGVVLAPPAAAADGMSSLRIGGVGQPPSDARAIQASGAVNLETLSLAPITSLRNDAIPLEKRGSSIAVAARRIGAGRILQLGYEDTWRWRMGGSDGAIRDHRMWWSGLLSSVAYAPRVPRTVETQQDEAPFASLVASIGPRSGQEVGANLGTSRSRWMVWLFIFLATALISEIASRRSRGAR